VATGDLTATYSGDRKSGNSYIEWRQEILKLLRIMATTTYNDGTIFVNAVFGVISDF